LDKYKNNLDINMKDSKYVAGYVSAPPLESIVKGSSLEIQKENIHREAEYRELSLPVIFENVSGYRTLKEEVKEGRISHLIIFSVFRTEINFIQMLQFIEECEKEGVKVYTICDGYDSDMEHTKLHVHIIRKRMIKKNNKKNNITPYQKNFLQKAVTYTHNERELSGNTKAWIEVLLGTRKYDDVDGEYLNQLIRMIECNDFNSTFMVSKRGVDR
jgi:hypothetical protein